jgi:UrcA family protein
MKMVFAGTKLREVSIAAGMILLATMPSPAMARVKPPAVVVMTVRYDDLDLASAKGLQTLRARVTQTADRLCLSPGVRSDDQMRADAECKKALVVAAEAQIHDAGRAALGDGSRELTLARGR